MRNLSYVLIGAAAILAIGVVVWNRINQPLIYSAPQTLSALWRAYKAEHLEQGSLRAVDKDRGNITTSEGQSYTMLRAVWMGDKPTFDTAWQWTQKNLGRNDHLFSWLYGKHANGTYGVLSEQGGNTAASDADEDIALSLIFAYARWQDPAYLAAAKGIVSDIWNKEVVTVQGTPYLSADDIEKVSPSATAVMNPSYWNPAAYRIFAKIDPTHPWNKLVDSVYTALPKVMAMPLGTSTSANIPPDWFLLNKTTGAFSAPAQSSITTNFGYDALRVPWRIALDYQWNNDGRAKDVLSRMGFLASRWDAQHAIFSTYRHDGAYVTSAEAPAMYGGVIGYFIVADPQDAQAVYTDKLAYLYDPDISEWKTPLSYYDSNWAWFGIALYNKLLPNLAASIPLSGTATTTP